MTNTDRILSVVIWACILGFIGYVLFQEVSISRQCYKSGGVVVITPTLSGVCVRRALESLPD